MALAAIAPEKPATNDVQPLRKAAEGPYASRRYTYSPPACGLRAASSAYAIAPVKANAPPMTQTARIWRASPTSWATMIGTKKMPPPMTLDTTIAAASRGPSRRSSECSSSGVVPITRTARTSFGEELPHDGHVGDWRPLGRAVLGEQADLGVDELGIFQHVGARFGA